MEPTTPAPPVTPDLITLLGSNADFASQLAQLIRSQQQGPPASVSVPNNDTNERTEDGTSSLSQNDVS